MKSDSVSVKRFYRWFKATPVNETMIEVTKDYFSEGDEHINESNGWQKMPKDFIEIKEKKYGNN